MCAWDSSVPAGTDNISLGDDVIREFKTDIEDALSADGVFPGSDTANPTFHWTGSRGATAGRPSSPVTGQIYFNTQTFYMEYWNGSAWTSYDLQPLVVTAKITDLNVTTGKLADLAVTTGKINDLAVTTGKINDLAVTTGKILSVVSSKVTGTTTNDDASAGVIGEVKKASVTTKQEISSSNVFTNITSISLTAGDWDVVGTAWYGAHGATLTDGIITVVSAYSGDTQTDHVDGDNQIYTSTMVSNNMGGATVIARFSLASTTTIYLKCNIPYSAGGPPRAGGTIKARRVR